MLWWYAFQVINRHLRVRLTSRREWAWLLAIWVIVTAYNLFKPYHIDDTAYLEIARWIGHHPLHPMSGELNWEGINEPIHQLLHPHLYLYLLAGWARIFGFTEPATHSLEALMSLACIVLFYRLARTLLVSSALWATALVFLGPAFIVEQNVMIDVPLLASYLGFFVLLIVGGEDKHQTRRYVLAALLCSAAILIKYSGAVLVPILWCSLLLENRQRQLWTALIPIAMVVAWSAFNYFDYGGVHILTRSVGASHVRLPRFTGGWILCTGALTPLGMVAVVQRDARLFRARARIYALAGAAFCVVVAAVGLGAIPDRGADVLMPIVFALNGMLTGIAVVLIGAGWLRGMSWRSRNLLDAAPKIYLLLWILGTSLFYILFAPFLAARHVLLILPAVTLLLCMHWGEELAPSSRRFALALTVLISSGLCLSDWRFADFYRVEATELAHSLAGSRQLWITGHWGWQWYAEQQGFQEWDRLSTALRPGDVIAEAEEGLSAAPRAGTMSLQLIRVDSQNHLALNLFCTGRPVRFYFSPFARGPWSLSRNCGNRVDVLQVDPPGEVWPGPPPLKNAPH